MRKNDVEVEELLRVLEKIRAEQYPDIPAAVIRDIVLSQYENQDDRTQGKRTTKKVIDDYLKTVNAVE